MNNTVTEGMSCTGVYVHIPFCRKKCGYCDFYSRAASQSVVEGYLKALINQISLRKDILNAGSVYFGGGTPSMLSPGQLESVMAAVSRLGISGNAEITLEVNPEDVTGNYAKAVRQIGFNRVSIGVQSFDDGELAALGRSHDSKTAENAVRILEKYFDNVSVDLMLATPAQTEKSLSVSLSMCKALQPQHISAYLMKVYENTLFGKKGVEEAEEGLAERLYLTAAGYLTSLGYSHYEVSSYAQPGKRSRHNMLYWTGGSYAAFGASACGYENGVRYRYANGAEAFSAEDGKSPVITEETETPSSVREEAVIFGLRTSDGVSFDLLTTEAYAYAGLLAVKGLTELRDGRLTLTDKGWLVSNEIITEILLRNESKL